MRPGDVSFLTVLVLTAASALFIGGCASDPGAPIVPLVHLSDGAKADLAAKIAALKVSAATSASNTKGGASEGAKTGPAVDFTALTDAEGLKTLMAECEVEQPATRPKAEGDKGEGSGTNAFGTIHQGTTRAPDHARFGTPKDGTFAWVEGNAEYIDPNLISESAGTAIASQFFEGLYVVAPGNTPPVPAVATGHTTNADGTIYTFKIRPGMVWSDGTPITSADVSYSWLRGLNPETASKNAQQLWYIKGAKDYNTGLNDDPASVAIRTPDPETVVVTLIAPTSFFIDLITYIAFAIVPRHTIETHAKQWIRPENIVVNGPYKPISWVPRDKMVMVKNPSYWGAADVSIERSIVLFSDDEGRNMRLYDTGAAHYIKPLPEDQVKQWISTGREDLRIDQQMCTYYYVLHMEKEPFTDIRVRRAFNMAIDKERLTKHVLSSLQTPSTHLVPPMFDGIIGYASPEGDAYNPEKALELLAEAGFPNGQGLPPLEITYNSFELHRLIAQFVQESLKTNLGISVVANNMEWKSLLKKVQGGDYQIARTSWCADYPDPMTFLTVFDSKGENNYPRYHNPVYDKLLADIKVETNVRARNVKICAAEKMLAVDTPIVPFYFYTRSYLLRPFVKGLDPQYQDHHLIKYMSINLPAPAAP